MTCPSTRFRPPPAAATGFVAFSRLRLRRRPEAPLQGLHEIDNLFVAFGILRRPNGPPLLLLLDHSPQRVLVAALELGRIEVAGLLVDDLAGDVQHARIGLG